jgi:hypothetical protein
MIASTKDNDAAFCTIARLVAEEGRRGPGTVSSSCGVQALVDVVSELCMQIEYLVQLRTSQKYEKDMVRYVSDLRTIYKSVGLPASLVSRHNCVVDAYLRKEDNIYFVGNADDMRFLIFISALPDLNRPPDPVDVNKSRFRLSKSKLRDAFLGLINEQTEVVSLVPPPVVSQQAPTEMNLKMSRDFGEIGGSDEKSNSLISHERIARAFFGYKGLRDQDPA